MTRGGQGSSHRRIAGVFWALRVEYLVRRRGLIELCEITGVPFQAASDESAREPVAGGASGSRLSAADHAIIAAVERLYRRWPVEGTCLRQCLVTGRLLRSRQPVLQIGVRRTESGDLVAHSWLAFAGQSFDPTASDYAQL